MIHSSRYLLRTIDAAGARAFYARVLGDVLPEEDIVSLPAEIVARGARPLHFLVSALEPASSAVRAGGGVRWIR